MARRGRNRDNASKEAQGSEADYWVQTIREIFPDPGWPSDKPVSDCEDLLKAKYLNDCFAGKRWQELPREVIQETLFELSWLTREALAYFMPAFLVCRLTANENPTFSAIDLDALLTSLLPARRCGLTHIQIQWLRAFWAWTIRDWAFPEDIEEANTNLEILELELGEWDYEDSTVGMRRFFSPNTAKRIRQIERAFEGVSRNGAMSWRESEIADNYGSEKGLFLFHDKDERWEDLVDDEDWQPEELSGGFAYLDAVTARYYLPAAMIKSIDQGTDAGIQFWLDHDRKTLMSQSGLMQRWSALNDEQRAAVVDFMKYMTDATEAIGKEDESVGWTKSRKRFCLAMGLKVDG